MGWAGSLAARFTRTGFRGRLGTRLLFFIFVFGAGAFGVVGDLHVHIHLGKVQAQIEFIVVSADVVQILIVIELVLGLLILVEGSPFSLASRRAWRAAA